MTCIHMRFLLIFVPFVTPLFAVIVARWLPGYDRQKDKYVLNAILIFCVLAGMARYFPSQSAIEQSVADHFPVGAVEYLRQHPIPGPMFNDYGLGGHLVGATGPGA